MTSAAAPAISGEDSLVPPKASVCVFVGQSVPCAHEGAMLELLADEPVPQLLGHDGGRVVLAGVPGEDLYDAPLLRLLPMVTLLVDLQRKFIGRTDELLAASGLPDWRAAPLEAAIRTVLERNRPHLTAAEALTLSGLVDDLPTRFAEIGGCGIPDTLVHGDFHPGNLRGDGERLTLLDWGDDGVSHPLLDQAAFLDRMPAAPSRPFASIGTGNGRRCSPAPIPSARRICSVPSPPPGRR